MTIYDNAISSLQLGLADFSSNKDQRLLSAVRNLHSGILLLYKAKLSTLSPPDSADVLIKKRILPKLNPDGHIVFVGDGNKTVDVSEIEQRFQSLSIRTDWERLRRISKARNDIEHYFSRAHRDTLRGVISDTFLIIRDFIADELRLDPKDQLGDEAWGILLSVSDVIEKEREECKRALMAIEWQNANLENAMLELVCSNCGSSLITPAGTDRDSGIECRSCGEPERFEVSAERALDEHMGWKNHVSLKDGGEEVLISCPFCHHCAYIVEDNECVVCGESCTDTCELCGGSIPVSELSGSLCGYCDHMLNKDD